MLALVEQYSKEIPDNYDDAKTHTFNTDFLHMLLVCVLVPFMHADTYRPLNAVKTIVEKDNYKSVVTEAMHVFVKKH